MSHHYQKRDIKSIVKSTKVDFQLVRETMYKYSKKAEEKFFKDPCMAFFFIQFAVSQQARTQILSKYVKNGSSQDMEGVDGHPELEKEHKGADISERILQEIA